MLPQNGPSDEAIGHHPDRRLLAAARGRSERVFQTHQDHPVKALALLEIADIEAANRYLKETCLPRYNAEFAVPAHEEGSTFVPWIGDETLREIRCEQYERMIGADNCVRIARMFVSLQKLR